MERKLWLFSENETVRPAWGVLAGSDGSYNPTHVERIRLVDTD